MKASEIRLEIVRLESSRRTFESIDPGMYADKIEAIDKAIAAFQKQLDNAVGEGWTAKRTAPEAQRNGLWVQIPELGVKMTIPPSLIEFCRRDPAAFGKAIVRFDDELPRLTDAEAEKLLEERARQQEEYEKARRNRRR